MASQWDQTCVQHELHIKRVSWWKLLLLTLVENSVLTCGTPANNLEIMHFTRRHTALAHSSRYKSGLISSPPHTDWECNDPAKPGPLWKINFPLNVKHSMASIWSPSKNFDGSVLPGFSQPCRWLWRPRAKIVPLTIENVTKLTTSQAILHEIVQIGPKSCHLLRKKMVEFGQNGQNLLKIFPWLRSLSQN